MRTFIQNAEDLNSFRRKFEGSHILNMVQEGIILLITWAIGVGKSTCMDEIIDTAIRSLIYDLVVVLVPQRQMIDERECIISPNPSIRVLNLKPRPFLQCGPINDALWRPLEIKNLGLLGRTRICTRCDNYRKCYWPNQIKDNLGKSQVVFSTQARLENDPFFLSNLVMLAEAENVLVLIDEINFTLKSFRRTFSIEELENFISVLRKMNVRKPRSINNKWAYLCEQLIEAPSEDLRSDGWFSSTITKEWLLAVQTTGHTIFGSSFRCIPYDIQQFCKSSLKSREKNENKLSYAISPSIPGQCIIFSGSASTLFSGYRLNRPITTPFEDYQFKNRDTVWHNIASRIGMRQYFFKNSPQILDFFAQLIIRRIKSGKKCLLVSKICFLDLCISKIGKILREEDCRWQVLRVNDLPNDHLMDETIIPIINYGMIGSNLFKEYDCAYCLNGYYTNEEAVDSILHDILSSDYKIPLKFELNGNPLRRKLSVENPEHEFVDINSLAGLALNQVEMEVVAQAVGRVRPFTTPREIITFQCGELETISYDYEHPGLPSIRKHFSIETKRQRCVSETTAAILKFKAKGLSQSKTAKELNLSISTIKRHWNLDQ